MKKAFPLMMILLLRMGAFAQSDDKPAPVVIPDFAIVDFSSNHSGDGYVCIVKYSDGKVFSLEKTLNMKVREGHLIDQDDMDAQQFKILDYFYKMGFEFLNTALVPNFQDNHYTVAAREKYPSVRFYFKRKSA